MRFLPLASLLLFFAAALGFRSALHRARWGSWGIVLFRRGSRAHDALFFLLPSLLVAECLRWALAAPAALFPPQPAGALLVAAGAALVFWAQLTMGESWRVGIPAERTPLVTRGPFARSRNPIYAGMLLAMAGVVLLAPTAPALLIALAAAAAIRLQVAKEEAHLEAQLGDAYRDYRRTTPRFI
jgi:isoprenylcysteine carboxyl methyltransferase (ICMT) family protein YpbQ